MPDEKTFHCSLITPDRVVLECAATFVALPAHDGEMGFLRGRAPLLCKLGIGEVRVRSADDERRFFLDGGFAQMLDNNLTVLTEEAEASGDIDTAQARKELGEALALRATDPASARTRNLAVARARARQRIAGSAR